MKSFEESKKTKKKNKIKKKERTNRKVGESKENIDRYTYDWYIFVSIQYQVGKK